MLLQVVNFTVYRLIRRTLYPRPWNLLSSSELSEEESGKASFVLDALIGWSMSDSSEEESCDVPGVALWISPPTDISINFLACLCISENFFPFLFFLSRFLVFSPPAFCFGMWFMRTERTPGNKTTSKTKRCRLRYHGNQVVCVTQVVNNRSATAKN